MVINKKKNMLILVVLLIALFIINYSFLNDLLVDFLDESDYVIVERVIDGDTIVVKKSESNETVRLLGINTPERGERLYGEAKDFLENLILDENVKLESGKDEYDLYNRRLAFVYFEGENVNLKLVEEGFASYYFPSGKEFGYYEFKEAWHECIESKKNLCEPSTGSCSECIEISEINFKSEILTLKNSCNIDCNLNKWELKDEGRKKFVFENFILKRKSNIEILVSKEGASNNQTTFIWERKTYVWTDSGDTAFLRNSKGKLVSWKGY